MESLLKLLPKLQKFVAKEFLWSLLSLILGVPVFLAMSWVIGEILPNIDAVLASEQMSFNEFVLYLYATSVVCVYFVHIVNGAIQTAVKKVATAAKAAK